MVEKLAFKHADDGARAMRPVGDFHDTPLAKKRLLKTFLASPDLCRQAVTLAG
jgi:hypothetical protein